MPIAHILGDKSYGVKASRLLCNLEKSIYINDKLFDEVIYDRAENASSKVQEFATSILEK